MKIPKQAYTLEFKELAVKRVKDGQSLAGVAKELGLVEQTLRNWVKAAAAGRLAGAGGKAVTPEEMELSRLRAENLRLKRELRARGFPASKARVERLMRERGIRARHKRRYKVTTDSKHGLPVAENLLDRNFQPSAPNQVWASDITYLWTDEGWRYLAIVMDLFNREIVGWSLKPRMTADIVTDALTMAWFKKRPAPGLLHHSDRGSQYASQDFQDRLRKYGMTCSMSRKGNCWDNAPTESGFNSFKNERVHGIAYASHADMRAASFEYIEVFYNRKRLHSTLGYRSPVQFLEHWVSQQTQEKLVA